MPKEALSARARRSQRRGIVNLSNSESNEPALRAPAFDYIRKGWSPQQIYGTLASMPQADGQAPVHVTHETIYQTMPRGEIRGQLIGLLRQGRKPKSRFTILVTRGPGDCPA